MLGNKIILYNDVYIPSFLLLFSPPVVSDSLWPRGLQHARLLSSTVSRSLRRLMSIESVMVSNHLIICLSLLLFALFFPSIRVFSSESALRIRWPKYWSFSLRISPSNEYSGLISFRIDCSDLLAVQETPAPQLECISSLALSLLYGLTSVHDYWKNRSMDYIDLCQQSDVSAF